MSLLPPRQEEVPDGQEDGAGGDDEADVRFTCAGRCGDRVAILIFELDDGFTMIIGANRAAIIYEIGVVDGVQAPVIVPAIKAREKFLT